MFILAAQNFLHKIRAFNRKNENYFTNYRVKQMKSDDPMELKQKQI